MPYDPQQLETDVSFLTQQPGWQDPAQRTEFIRSTGVQSRAYLPPEDHAQFMSELWNRADDRGMISKALDWTGTAISEVVKSGPAMAAGAAFAVGDALGVTDTGSGTRLERGVTNLVDQTGQTLKQLAPGESMQAKRDAALEALRTDLDAGRVPADFERWAAGEFDSEGKPDAETQQFIDALRGDYARLAVEADQINASQDQEKVRAFMESDRSPTRPDSDIPGVPGPRELLADYLATRDPSSWEAFKNRVTETDQQYRTRLQRWTAEQRSGTAETLAQMAEGLNKEMTQRAFDIQTSPIDLATAALPFLRGAKALQAARTGGVLAQTGRLAAGAGKEALQEGVTEKLQDARATAGQVFEAAAMGAVGGAALETSMAGVGALLRPAGVGQPMSEAPAAEGAAMAEDTGDLTAADVADLDPQPTPPPAAAPQRQPILTGVPDRMGRMRETSLNEEPVMEGDVITDLRIPRSPEALAESQRIENDRLVQEAKLRAQDAKARGMPMIADNPNGSRDILDWANENPIYLPPGFSTDRKLPEYEALGRNPLPSYWRQFVASGKQGGNPDTIAQRAYDAGLIAEPTADAYVNALQEGIAGRQQYRVQFAERDKALAQEEKRVVDFEKTQGKLAKKPAAQEVTFEDVVPGDRMTIDGEPAVVRNVEYNEDGYLTNVVIEDGKRFGLMQFDPQTRGGLLVDEFKPKSSTPSPAPSRAATAPASPTASGTAANQTSGGGTAASPTLAPVAPAASGNLNPQAGRPRAGEAGFVNAEILRDLAASAIQAGQDFATWARAMLARFGEVVRAQLAAIWQQAQAQFQAREVRFGGTVSRMAPAGTRGFVAVPGGESRGTPIPEGQNVTASRFANPDEAANLYDVQATEVMRGESAAWIDANGLEAALAALEANEPPAGLRIDHLPSLGSALITRLSKLAETGTEAQRLQADALLSRAGAAWHGKASQEAGRTLQQRAMANQELVGIAPILAAKQVLTDRADRVVKERFEGGAEGAVEKITTLDVKAGTEASAELTAQLEGEPDAPELGDNPEVTPVNDTRVAELEQQMQELRQQMLRDQTQAENALQETTSTWQKIMGVLKAAGGRRSSLLTGAKGKLADLRKAAMARKAARRAEGRMYANPVGDFADDAIIGASFLAEGLVEFTNWSQALIREIGFRSGQDLRKLYAEASKQYLAALEAEKAAPTRTKGTPKQRQAREKINRAQRTAQNILDSIARRYSDPPIFEEGQSRINAMRELYKERVRTGMPEAEFVKRAMALGANEGTAGILWEASKLEIDAREMLALEKSRAGLAEFLKKDSPALAKLLNALRQKIAPGMSWAQIFMELPAQQKARQREIYRRLMLDERLKALNQAERLQLTNELDKAWQRERRKVFLRELEKITNLGKSKKDKDKVKAALPRLLRLMNLGMLNSETFRGAIAQEYGIKQIDAATGVELRKLAEAIQQAPEGLPRRKLEQQLMQRLQNLTGSTMAEVLESWWTASVLSGWRTQVDIALSLANGLEDVTFGSLVTAVRTGNGRVAKDALFAMLANLPTAMNEALDHLLTGNRAAMRSYDAEVKAALEDGSKLFGNVGRQLLNKGGMARLPGAFMEFVSRVMTALDHINSTSTYEGAKAMALARHPEIYEKALRITPQDRQAARTQARLELTAGEAPTTRQQRIEEEARMKEILDQRVPLEVQAQAREIGLESALQGEPTGVGAWIYRASNALNNVHRQSLSEYEKNRPDNLAGRAVLRALRITSPLVKVLTGTKFVRTVGHSINRSLSYAPGVGLIRFAEKGMQGSPAKADILLAKQLFGTAVGLALLMAFRDGEDDEQGIEGSWRGLTPQQKGQLLAEGKQPYSIWTRDAQGRIRTWNYQNWGIAGVLGTIGGMEDQRRYNSQGKDDLAILIDGIISGSMAWTDKAQLTGLKLLTGSDQPGSSSNPAQSWADTLNRYASTTVGGVVPRLFKDVDMVISPQLRDTSEWWMKWAAQMPMVRETSSGKRVNIFGEDIVLDRTPTSRITQVGTLDPALRTLGRLNERDIWLPDPTQGVRTVKLADGTRRKMTTVEKDRYQRATGAAYRKFITEQGAALLRMDAELARETISKVTERLRKQAAYDAVRR